MLEAGATSPEQRRENTGERTVVPDHELIRKIGGGSYGEVWLARHVRLGTLRAVKIVRRDRFDDARPFQREFDGIRCYEPISRSHPNLVAILHVGGTDDCFFYVMELADAGEVSGVKGQISDGESAPSRHLTPDTGTSDTYTAHTLRSELKRHGALPIDRCLEIGLALAGALAHLHARGLVHRDVKPSNVIFVGGVAKLADIGLVAAVSDSRSFVGTEGYIPPEGPGTPSADCYALGKLLYELSTGHDRTAWPEPPANLPTRLDRERLLELNAILHKACAAEARQRYQASGEMVGELKLLERGESVKLRRRRARQLSVAKRITFAVCGTAIAAVLGYSVSKSFISNHPKRETGATTRRSTDKRGATNETAYAAYKAGKEAATQHTRNGFTESVAHFNRAIELDPNFARAYLALAEGYREAADWYLPPKQVMSEARRAAVRAIEIDDSLAEAHLELAMVMLLYDWNFSGAENAIRRALELKPNYVGNHNGYSWFLRVVGRMEEAHAEQQVALRLAPKSAYVHANTVALWCQERQYGKALDQIQAARAAHTNAPWTHMWLGWVYEQTGRFEEAIKEFEAGRAWEDGPDLMGLLGHVYAVVGRDKDARSMLQKLHELRAYGYVSPYCRAWIHAGLDEKQEALGCLQEACEERSGHVVGMGMFGLKTDPHFDSLRSDPRFSEFLRKVGFTE